MIMIDIKTDTLLVQCNEDMIGMTMPGIITRDSCPGHIQTSEDRMGGNDRYTLQ